VILAKITLAQAIDSVYNYNIDLMLDKGVGCS
jgi:hypothetical protein